MPPDDWQATSWTIVLGDCLAVMRELPRGSVDVIVTSPPYNIGVNYSQHDDQMRRSAFLSWLGECFAELHRVLRDDGSFFLNVNGSGTKDDFLYAACDRGSCLCGRFRAAK